MLETETPVSAISSQDARRAARNASALAAASIISKGVLFGWQLILAPFLGPAEYGVYGTVLAFNAIAMPLAGFGMSMIVIRDVARQPERAGKYLSIALFAQTLLALVAYVAMNAAAAALGYETHIRGFVAVAGLSVLVDMFGNLAHDQLLAKERMLVTSMVEIGQILLRVALALVALIAGYGLLGVYVAALLSGLVRVGILWRWLLKAGVRPQWPLDRALAWPLLVNSAPLALSAFLALTYSHLDKLMTSALLTTRETGYLTVAFVVIFGVVEILNGTILIAVYPMMSRFLGLPLFAVVTEKLAMFTAVISLPVSLLLSLFTAELTVPFFGEDFRPTAGVLAILIWYALVTMVGNAFAQAMMIQNRQRALLLIRSAGLALNFALNLRLLPVLGVRGAAAATLLSEVVTVSVLLVIFREAAFQKRRLIAQLLRLAGLGVGSALAMLALGQAHFLLGIAGGLAVYAAGIFLLPVLSADDWDFVYRLLAALPGGGLIRRYWRREVVVNW